MSSCERNKRRAVVSDHNPAALPNALGDARTWRGPPQGAATRNGHHAPLDLVQHAARVLGKLPMGRAICQDAPNTMLHQRGASLPGQSPSDTLLPQLPERGHNRRCYRSLATNVLSSKNVVSRPGLGRNSALPTWRDERQPGFRFWESVGATSALDGWAGHETCGCRVRRPTPTINSNGQSWRSTRPAAPVLQPRVRTKRSCVAAI